MEVQIAVSKVKKYASSASGDTVEVIERPHGGVSVVMADGQSSGKGAKWVSSFVARKVISLLAEGVRDGAAARAAADTLYTERGGKVSATLNILSADLVTKTVVCTRNNPAPVLLARNETIAVLDEESSSIGFHRNIRPVITQIEMQAGLTVVIFTDGILHAGSREGRSMAITTCLQSVLEEENPSSQTIADSLLHHALRLDQGRPNDDVTVVVLRVLPMEATDSRYGENLIRRMTVRLPTNL